jgi:hypothetical protein
MVDKQSLFSKIKLATTKKRLKRQKIAVDGREQEL